ncbi:MAG: hypothetical protein AAB850_00500, partial [Patescibacteria group bacterium]
IGGNDAVRLQASCAGEVSCMLGGVVPMLTEYEHNLERIFSTLRNVYSINRGYEDIVHRLQLLGASIEAT